MTQCIPSSDTICVFYDENQSALDSGLHIYNHLLTIKFGNDLYLIGDKRPELFASVEN